ncbi:threonine aspartase 1-like [Argiope bruennichi]|uniref:Threonine aspartase 1 like protein n=1 Tax=Argiope bruennichi TaxID=94029 RepID=A0A8T0F0C0_ARGBR|nr:threonine aspartase 1-like [Argiope bruennichi]KAF8784576.1 Threonine aspartase 1 like protein [Argiope bruennichi]
MMSGIIAVHVGAGYHGAALRTSFKEACEQACQTAIPMLRSGCHAVDAVTEAVVVLENCPLTNAGIGSNRTLTGDIECEAGVMDGDSMNYGAVGALHNIKNPIKVARAVLEEQRQGFLTGGRIPPCAIVGEGALNWALDHGFTWVDESDLITDMSEKNYKTNLDLLVEGESTSTSAAQAIYSSSGMVCSYPFGNEKLLDTVGAVCVDSFGNDKLLDTVGAVCVDSFGNVASAVSSGGLIMKQPGRIGQSSIYGSGCWAENSSEYCKPSVACTATGAGEYLIKTLFARECYNKLHEKYDCASALQDVFREKFVNSPFLRDVKFKIAGVLSLKHYKHTNLCEIDWTHNTKTMIVGYGCTKDRKIATLVSEQPFENVNIHGSGVTIAG